jgi:hypothetical protein
MNNLPNLGGCRMLGMVWCGGMKPVANANNGGPGVECGGTFPAVPSPIAEGESLRLVEKDGAATNDWLASRLETLSGSLWSRVMISAI